MITCANCTIHACKEGDLSKAPKNCPCIDEYVNETKEFYKGEDYNIAHSSALVESEGYCKKTRVEETMDFARKCGYKNIGIAFCVGFSNEARILSKVLVSNGFEVNSIICKCGSISKKFIDIKDEQQVNPGNFEPMCNPIGQAKFLNKAKTDLNILLGLCVGHDSLFFKHSEAPSTVLGVKDRVLGHNPVVALYQAEAYYKNKLFPKK